MHEPSSITELLGADFLASRFINEHEAPPLLVPAINGGVPYPVPTSAGRWSSAS